jgi:hypothetical protein
VREALETGAEQVTVRNNTQGTEFPARTGLTRRQASILLAGGLLNYTRTRAVQPV